MSGRNPQDDEWPSELSVLAERYAHAAVGYAVIKHLDSGEYFAAIPGFVGVWAASDQPEGLMEELEEVVREWTLLKLRDGDPDLPVLPNFDLRPV